MSQNTVIVPSGGIVSGLTMAIDINAALDSVRTCWSGASAPSADTPEEGQLWLDTSVAGYITLRQYDGGSWVGIWTVNTTTHSIVTGVAGQRTAVADAGYSATIYDRTIAYTSITATRAVALPTAASYPAGITLRVVDESGQCSSTLALTLTPNGADVIKGPPGQGLSVTLPYGYIAIESNGTNQWTVVGASPVASIPGGGGF
jgi:hypothetical protein